MKNKSALRGRVILAIVLAVYFVLAFVIPFEKTAVFWLSLLFTVIAIAAQAYVLKIAFVDGKFVRSKFYGYPIARIGIIYAAVQIVLGFLFMALGKIIPPWICVVIYVLILAAAVIGLIAADAVREEVERQDEKLKKNVDFMRTMQSRVRTLSGQCENADAAAAVQKLDEAFRFSDPVSSEALAEAERELSACVDTLQGAVADGDWAAVKTLCRKTEQVLAERNRICKLNK